MNEEDIEFLKSVKNKRPSSEIFEKMVQILKNTQEKSDQLLKDSLSEKA